MQRTAQVVDVTGMAAALELHKQQQESADREHTDPADTDTPATSDTQQQGVKPTKKSKAAASAVVTSESTGASSKGSAAVPTFALPSRITQFEIRSPSEDKDALTYLFLLKVSAM